MSERTTKEKVLQAAITLFYQKGFSGTSVRDIAERAKVNVSLISYYFKNKQGLLEYAVINYYEQYLKELELVFEQIENENLLDNIETLLLYQLEYKVENYNLTAFIFRELSLDTNFVREISVTYIAKEEYILRSMFERVVGKRRTQENELLFIQLKGILNAPFTTKNEWNQTYISTDDKKQLVKSYANLIKRFLSYCMIN